MADEVGTMTTRTETPNAADSLFCDTKDSTSTSVPEGEMVKAERASEQQGTGVVEMQVTDDKAERNAEGPDDAGSDDVPSDDLKVVVSVKGGRATIGVQRPSADPHIETFEDRDLSTLAQEVIAVAERARVRWKDTPKHPAYTRPAPPAKRRNRRQQGASQDATASGENTEQAQQQTLQLF